MRNYLGILLLLIGGFNLCYPIKTYAQDEVYDNYLESLVGFYGVTFLREPISPNEDMLSGAYAALPKNSANAAWYNPAQLGMEMNYRYSLGGSYQNKYFIEQINGMRNLAFRYNNSFQWKNRVIQYGFSYHYFQFDYGEQTQTDESGNPLVTTHPRDHFNSLSIGLGTQIKKGWNLSVGYTLRHIYSYRGAENYESWVGEEYVNPTVFAQDLGLFTEVNPMRRLRKSEFN